MNYKLVPSTHDDIENIINYKLDSILKYASSLSNQEKNRIINYVKKSVPEQINNYNSIVLNDLNIGCLLIEKFLDGIIINELYIIDKFRGLGIGSSILRDIIRSNDLIYLWVYKDNSRALNLYQKLGFKVKEETDSRMLMYKSK